MEIIVALIALVIGAPAPGDGIRVSPGEARAGQQVHLTVPDCAVGPTRHTATSPAFTHRATLHGKADTGEADTRIRYGLAPGTYRITASCGANTLFGRVVVAGPPPRPAQRSGGSNGVYWVLAAAAATGGGALLIARLRRR